MTDPFQLAWMLLKDMSNNTQHHREMMDALKRDSDTYGDISNREHPLQGQEGYEDNARGGRGHEVMPPADRNYNDDFSDLGHAQSEMIDESERMDEEGSQMSDEEYNTTYDDRADQEQKLNHRYREADNEQEHIVQEDNPLARHNMGSEGNNIDAMGVEPMGQQLGGKPPANIGQAGSLSDANPEKHSINPFAMDDAMNTFRPPQELHDWAQTHGPSEPSESLGQPPFKNRTVEDHMGAWDGNAEHAPLQEGADTHSTGGTMGASPRHERRGQEGAGRAHDRPGFRSAEHMPLQDRR